MNTNHTSIVDAVKLAIENDDDSRYYNYVGRKAVRRSHKVQAMVQAIVENQHTAAGDAARKDVYHMGRNLRGRYSADSRNFQIESDAKAKA